MDEPRQSPGNPTSRPRFKLASVVFPLVVAIIVILILTDMFPQLKDARDKFLKPTEHQARQVCQAAALAAAGQPAYARIRTPGTVHATQGASYVEGVSVGEMGPTGAELSYTFTCYVDSSGALVKTHKQATTEPARSP